MLKISRAAIVGTIAAAVAFPAGVYGPDFIRDYRAQLGKSFATNDLGVKLISPVPTRVQTARDCAIGRFGQFPWVRKDQVKDEVWAEDTYQWARMNGLPHTAAVKYVDRSRTGAQTGTLKMYNNRIVASNGKKFSGSYGGSYQKDGIRYTCYNSRTNFSNDTHWESAAYYEIEDGGQVYELGEPYACFNPQRLVPEVDYSLPSAPYLPTDPKLFNQGRYPGNPNAGAPIPNIPGEQRIYYVPEPGSLVLVVLGLIVLFVIRRKRATKRKS